MIYLTAIVSLLFASVHAAAGETGYEIALGENAAVAAAPGHHGIKRIAMMKAYKLTEVPGPDAQGLVEFLKTQATPITDIPINEIQGHAKTYLELTDASANKFPYYETNASGDKVLIKPSKPIDVIFEFRVRAKQFKVVADLLVAPAKQVKLYNAWKLGSADAHTMASTNSGDAVAACKGVNVSVLDCFVASVEGGFVVRVQYKLQRCVGAPNLADNIMGQDLLPLVNNGQLTFIEDLDSGEMAARFTDLIWATHQPGPAVAAPALGGGVAVVNQYYNLCTTCLVCITLTKMYAKGYTGDLNGFDIHAGVQKVVDGAIVKERRRRRRR